MFQFSSKYINTNHTELPYKIGEHCKQYLVESDGKFIGQVLSSDNFTWIDYGDHSVKIDRLRYCNTQKTYYLNNYKTETVAATIEFLSRNDECIVNINEGSTYFFHKNQADWSLLKPTSWFLFEHHLTDSADDITITGNLPFNGLPSGIIYSTNEQLILPILAGLSIIEEKLRTFNETSG